MSSSKNTIPQLSSSVRRKIGKSVLSTTKMDKFVVQNKTSVELEWIINNLGGIDDGIYSPEFSATALTASNKLVNVRCQLQLHRSVHPDSVAISLRNLTDQEVSVTSEITLYNSGYMLDDGKIEGKSGKKESWVLDLHVLNHYDQDVFQGYGFDVVSDLDDLKVICSISNVTSDATGGAGAERADDSVSGHTTHYENLLESGKFGDVMFNVGEKSMHLHKAILTSESEVFRAMFDHEMREQKESVVDVVDVDFDVMKEMLRYIYARRVNGIKKIAAELYVVAHRYAVEGLKQLCENKLVDELNVDNALSHFELSVKYDMVHLKPKVLDFVVRNMKELVGKREFKEFSSDCRDELFSYIATKTLIINDP